MAYSTAALQRHNAGSAANNLYQGTNTNQHPVSNSKTQTVSDKTALFVFFLVPLWARLQGIKKHARCTIITEVSLPKMPLSKTVEQNEIGKDYKGGVTHSSTLHGFIY